MKLTEKQVDIIIRKIIEVLKQKTLITFKEKEGVVLDAMKKTFLKNLREEEDINSEAKKLIEQYRRSSKEPIDENKMFNMIKKEICKKRNFVR